MNTITFHDTTLHLEPDTQHEFLLTNKEVALGYGIAQSTLRSNFNNNKDELIEGKHWIKKVSATKGGKQKVIHWTKKGIVRLGFFIKSEKAKEFRDWAEDYIVNTTQEQHKQNLEKNKFLSKSEIQTHELCQLIEAYAPPAFKELLMKNLQYIKDIANGEMCISDDVSMDINKLIEQGIKYEKLHKKKSEPQRKELLKEIVELNKENATLKSQLSQALTPDNIWILVNDGLKFRDLKKIAPLLR